MNQYVTGAMIKKIREERSMTQLQLAEKLCVSDKSISKWETGRGYPDISLLEPLARALGISIIELLSGEDVTNTNHSYNMNRMNFYVCPVCGNVLMATGEAVISCCGITLVPSKPEEPDEMHRLQIEIVEDEYYVSLSHEMRKSHFISFIAGSKEDGLELTKLYPEGSAEARFKIRGMKRIYYYCNHHGLFVQTVKPKDKTICAI